MKYVTKRDGSQEPYDINKIQNVIQKAFARTDENSEDNIKSVLTYFVNHFSKLDTVEEIQDAVEKSLMSKKFFKTAKEFILYRKQRENIRNSKTSLTKTFKEVLSADGSDISRENANVDGKAPMGLMLLFGSEIEKDYVKRYMISPRFTELHESGDIHIHDMNMYACTFNCCNIGLKDLLGKGFNTGHGNIREPQSIQSAMSLTAIIVQANQNDMFGGQGIPLWDYELTKYVAKSFGKRLKEVLEIYLGYDLKDNTVLDYVNARYENTGTVLGDLDDVKSFISFLGKENTDKIVSKALQLTEKDVFQACEGFVHNLNTLNSRCLPKDEEVVVFNIKNARTLDKMSEIEKSALRDLMIDLYRDHTLYEIADEFSCSRKVIRRIFKKLEIPVRDKKEAYNFASGRWMEKYGVSNPSCLNEIKEKIRKTQFENHGCFAFNTEKQKQTNLERYGFENCSSNEEIKAKVCKTNFERYGYEHTFQIPEFREKARKTINEKYGCDNVLCAESPIRQKLSYARTKEVNDKMVKTKFERYGAYESSETKEKRRQTCLERYGFNTFPFFLFIKHTSKAQEEIFEFIKLKFPNLNTQLNVVGLFKQYPELEVDIWIPEIRLGIEYNGIYWHNKSLYTKDLTEGTITSKERYKDLYAYLNDIKLIQIWEDDYLSDTTSIYERLEKTVTDLIEIEVNNG